jgi:hypothetical protein
MSNESFISLQYESVSSQRLHWCTFIGFIIASDARQFLIGAGLQMFYNHLIYL